MGNTAKLALFFPFFLPLRLPSLCSLTLLSALSPPSLSSLYSPSLPSLCGCLSMSLSPGSVSPDLPGTSDPPASAYQVL